VVKRFYLFIAAAVVVYVYSSNYENIIFSDASAVNFKTRKLRVRTTRFFGGYHFYGEEYSFIFLLAYVNGCS